MCSTNQGQHENNRLHGPSIGYGRNCTTTYPTGIWCATREWTNRCENDRMGFWNQPNLQAGFDSKRSKWMKLQYDVASYAATVVCALPQIVRAMLFFFFFSYVHLKRGDYGSVIRRGWAVKTWLKPDSTKCVNSRIMYLEVHLARP